MDPRVKPAGDGKKGSSRFFMRAEIQALVDEIRDSLTLLRRHL
jgi:hypothetical protein